MVHAVLGLEKGAPIEAAAVPAQHRRLLLFLLAVSIAILWLPQLPSSLWTDECYVYAWINDGFSEAFHRGHLVSAVHVALLWGLKQLFGSSEWLLRVPSLIAAGLSVMVLVRLGAMLFDSETGLLAAIVLVNDNMVAFAASDARPYALALLATLAAVYFLVRWLRTGRRTFALAYVLCASATVYLQLFFATMFVVHGLYIWWERSRPWVTLRTICGMAVMTGLLVLPMAVEVVRLGRQRELYFFSGLPSVFELAAIVAPPVTVLGLFIGIILATAASSPLEMRWQTDKSGELAGLLAWVLGPPLVLFIISMSTAAKIFVPRYTLCATPAICLLIACAVRWLAPPRARRLVAGTIVVVAVTNAFSMSHGGEDWRAAVAAAKPYTTGRSTPVLVRSGTIESRGLEWLTDSEKRTTTLAPLTYYRLDADVIPLPWDLGSQAERNYMERVASEHLLSVHRFVLIARTVGDNGTFAAWLRGRVGPLGFCPRSLGNFGAVEASVFEHNPSVCAAQP